MMTISVDESDRFHHDICDSCNNNVFDEQAWAKLWAARPYASNSAFILERLRSEIDRSLSAKCWFCMHIVDKVNASRYRVGNKDEKWRFGYALVSPVVGEPRKIHKLLVNVILPTRPWSRTVAVEFTMFANPMTPEASHIMAPELSIPGEIRALPDSLKTWFDQCREQHDGCQAHGNVALPSRLLDTQPVPGNDDVVRLHVAKEGETGEYAALSYCWGEVKNRFVVTQATVKDALQKMEWSALHKTYQDAIKVCQKIGIRYLWIDAVCILQDKDNRDKSTEMPRMHQYYKNASVVISAAEAKNAEAGFIEDSRFQSTAAGGSPNLEQKDFCTVRAWSHDGQPIRLTIGSKHTVYKPQSAAIESRGWTLQERLLAPRIMHFLSDGAMLMVCNQETRHNELIVFETFYPPRDSIHRLFQGDEPFYDNLLPGMAPDVAANHHVFGSWLTLVGAYGVRKLTEPSDKFIAFASLAEEYQLQHGHLLGKYSAGIWSKKVAECLCWISRPGYRPSIPYRAPSWSWASADFAYYAIGNSPELHDRFTVSVINIETQPTIPGFIFGSVLDGKLTVQARCREATWRIRLRNTDEHRNVEVLTGNNSSILAEVDHSDKLPSRSGENVLLLALGMRSEVAPQQPPIIPIICLILQRTVEDVFVRVGFLSRYDCTQDEQDQWPERVIAIR